MTERKAPPPDEDGCRLVWNAAYDGWELQNKRGCVITKKYSIVRRYAVQRFEEELDVVRFSSDAKRAWDAREQVHLWKGYK